MIGRPVFLPLGVRMVERTSGHADRGPIFAAAMAGVVVLLFGVAYRVLEWRLVAPMHTAVITPDALSRFPLELGQWAGRDIPLDDAVVRTTGTDAHINRQYSQGSGAGSVLLYVAYGTRVDDVMSHRPEGCYRAAGWTLEDRRVVNLQLPDGTWLPCCVFRCSHPGLDAGRSAVLHYLIVDGMARNDVSFLTSRMWRVFSLAGYIAQVEIVASSEVPTDNMLDSIIAFAVDSAPSITRLFENSETGVAEDGIRK